MLPASLAGRLMLATLVAMLLAMGAADARTTFIGRILYKDDFPVDIRHNSKIDRQRLGRWAAVQP